MKGKVIALLGCLFVSAVFSQVVMPFVPRYKPDPPGEPTFDDLFTHLRLGEEGSVCIVKRRGYYTGMRFFETCEQAEQVCPIMIFPELMTHTFTMEGVKFPVRIVAIGFGGREALNGVFAPGIKKIKLPPDTILVIEVPECNMKVEKM